MANDQRFDPASYDKCKPEDLLAFDRLAYELYHALELDPHEERAWSEGDIDAFVDMLLSDKGLLAQAATRLPVLREPFTRECPAEYSLAARRMFDRARDGLRARGHNPIHTSDPAPTTRTGSKPDMTNFLDRLALLNDTASNPPPLGIPIPRSGILALNIPLPPNVNFWGAGASLAEQAEQDPADQSKEAADDDKEGGRMD